MTVDGRVYEFEAVPTAAPHYMMSYAKPDSGKSCIADDPRLEGCIKAVYHGRRTTPQGSSTVAKKRPVTLVLDAGASQALTLFGQGTTTLHEAAEMLRCAAAEPQLTPWRMPTPTNPIVAFACRMTRPATVKRCKKDIKDKRERMDRDALEGLLFDLFASTPRWTFDALVAATEQPTAYMREVLPEVAVQCKKRQRNSQQTWELQPQYKPRE